MLAACSVVAAGAARAGEEPTRVAAYCSPSGDLCYGIFRERTTVLFDIDLVARIFGRYSLCVRPPRGAETCHAYPVRRVELGDQTTWRSEIRWQRSFPVRGHGRYTVTWRADGRRLGPALSFRG